MYSFLSSLATGSVIFTAYGIIFLHINSYVFYIFLFLLQAVPALFMFLAYLYVTKKHKFLF